MPCFLPSPRDSDLTFVRLKHQRFLKALNTTVQPGLRITALVYQLMTDKFP